MWDLLKNHKPQVVFLVEIERMRSVVSGFVKKCRGVGTGLLCRPRVYLEGFWLYRGREWVQLPLLCCLVTCYIWSSLRAILKVWSSPLCITLRFFRHRFRFGRSFLSLRRLVFPRWLLETSMPLVRWSFNHYAAKSKFFNDFISFSNLFDLGFSGLPYTWCNG